MMSSPTVRLLPFAVATGPENMARDEVLLHAAESGIASLRFYGWSPATLSLGYFQPATARLADPALAALPWVRRPSGGATLVHDRELTYALALPAGAPWHSGEPWMCRMHAILGRALATFGLADRVASLCGEPRLLGEVLCFQQQTPGDLICAGHKVVGSAQRKRRLCLLQHGAILLERSPFTPALPGVRDLTEVTIPPTDLRSAIEHAFATATGWSLEPADWTSDERDHVETLVQSRYDHESWNAKR